MSEFHRRRGSRSFLVGCCYLFALSTACSELRGRRRVREGNRLYREGRFAAALEQYRRAEPLAARLPLLWLNEGLTCRQMMVPGAKTAENGRAIDCALVAFEHLKQVAPADPRAESLYVQTLFEGDRFDTLAARYSAQLTKDGSDVGAVNGLIQVSLRASRPEEALRWYERRAALLPNDAEAQYAVGVFAWQQLYQRGGGPDKAGFDPRPDPAATPLPRRGRKARTMARGKNKGTESAGKTPPAFSLGDIVGGERAALADLGILYLQRAVTLRPNYQEAMVYLNLLYRQKSMAYFDQPQRWQAAIDAAEKWRALATVHHAATDAPPPRTVGVH